MCLLLSVFLDVISPILIKDIYVGTIARSVLMITYIFIIFRYAPADTENHPLVKKEVRKQLKSRAVIVSIIYCLLAIFAKPMWFVNILMLMETYVVISILPVSYKIFRRRYNNYEEFNDEIKSIVTNKTVLQVCTFALVVGSVAIGRCIPGYAHEPKLPNELIEK